MRSGDKTNGFGLAAALLAEAALIAGVGWVARRGQRRLENQQCARRAVNAAEAERARIARELHDDVGQRLSLIAMQLSAIGGQNNGAECDLADARRELEGVITDLHDLSHTLHPATLNYQGLAEAIADLSRNLMQHYPLKIELRLGNLPHDLDPEVGLCFYRVAQEALSNVIRHSESVRAEVRLLGEGKVLKMTVVDSGRGFAKADARLGLGLRTMEERAAAIGGRISVKSSPGSGTTLLVKAPFERLSTAHE